MSSKTPIGAISLLVFCMVLTITMSGCGAGGGNAQLLSSDTITTGGSGSNGSGSNGSGSNGSGSNGSSTNNSGASIYTKLSWEAPLTYDDGVTRIEPGDLTGYRVYLYTDSELTTKYADYLVSGPSPTTSINLTDFNTAVFTEAVSRGATTTYYLAVTAIVMVEGTDIESGPSNSVSYSYP